MDTPNINQWFKNHRPKAKTASEYQPQMPAIHCKDGFTISIQASQFHYCTPRVDGLVYYREVECGFPSEKPDLIMEFCEDSERPTETVYGYVPVHLVEKLIASHGGCMDYPELTIAEN